jgi:hypothetical protein
MISDVYQTVLSAYAFNDTGLPEDEVYAYATIYVPPHANFSAQICLCEDDFFLFQPGPVPKDGSEGWATPYILRYVTYNPLGGFTITWLGGTPTVNNVQNGYLITFGLRAWSVNSVASATAIGTVFIKS